MFRVVTLMENRSGTGTTKAEHGLSFWIQVQGRGALFDTGQSGGFLDNAPLLGVDVAAAELLALSHGHYDHGGGVRSLYEETPFRGPLWTGPDFFDKKWSDEAPAPRFIGVDFDEAYLRFRGVEHFTVGRAPGDGGVETHLKELLPGLYALNGFPRNSPLEYPNPRFVVDRPSGRWEDDFRDELCLVVDLPQGLAVFLGCSHPGIMNMLETARKAFHRPLYAVFGGSHLVDADTPRLSATLEYLEAQQIPLLFLGHCTGPVAEAALEKKFPSFHPLVGGFRFEL
jgi:7,8-dihydropterin-6-yl-methyl-4-(beta-D-ribofuranosyl)aminobenzene 5'-phosphate synthase